MSTDIYSDVSICRSVVQAYKQVVADKLEKDILAMIRPKLREACVAAVDEIAGRADALYDPILDGKRVMLEVILDGKPVQAAP